MRNLDEYPVTQDEIIACLERLKFEALAKIERDLVCGDMTPILLAMAVNLIRDR